MLLASTTGRRTGKERTAPLLYLESGENLVIVASVGGAPKHPAWYLNLKAGPEARVEIEDRTLRVRAEEAKGEEKRRLWRGSSRSILLTRTTSDARSARSRSSCSVP